MATLPPQAVSERSALPAWWLWPRAPLELSCSIPAGVLAPLLPGVSPVVAIVLGLVLIPVAIAREPDLIAPVCPECRCRARTRATRCEHCGHGDLRGARLTPW